MKCPKCKGTTFVSESYSIYSKTKTMNMGLIKRLKEKLHDCIIRRRKCTGCNKIFITYESIYEPLQGF